MRTSLLLTSLLLVAAASASSAAPPENPVGELLFKARELDGMKRLSASSFFEGGGKGDTALVLVELRVEKDHLRSEFVQFSKSGGWEGERFGLNFGGSLRELQIATGKGQVDPKPEDVTKGVVAEGTLVLTAGGADAQPKRIPLPDGPILSMPSAIFVVAPYYELLPEGGLSFAALLGKDLAPGFKLSRGKAEGAEHSVLLVGMGLELTIWISTAEATRGQVERLVIQGDTKRRLTRAEGERVLLELEAARKEQAKAPKDGKGAAAGFASPKAALDAFVAGCQAADMKAVAACFSSAAPKEFQTLKDGTCPPKQFKKLCEMFEACIIGEVRESDGVAKATIDLGDRKETLTLVREQGAWLILDF